MPSSHAGLPTRNRPFPPPSTERVDTNANDCTRTGASACPIWPRNASVSTLQQAPIQFPSQPQSRNQILLTRLQRLQFTLNDYGPAISILQFLVQKSWENPLHYPPHPSFLAHAKRQTDCYAHICDIATTINAFLISLLTSPPNAEAEALLSAVEVRIDQLEAFTARLLEDDKDHLTFVAERNLWGQPKEDAAGLFVAGWNWQDASGGVGVPREEESVDPPDASRPNDELAGGAGMSPDIRELGRTDGGRGNSEMGTYFSDFLGWW